MPVSEADDFRKASDVEKNVAASRDTFLNSPIDSVDRSYKRACQAAVEATEQAFGGRNERFDNANRNAAPSNRSSNGFEVLESGVDAGLRRGSISKFSA